MNEKEQQLSFEKGITNVPSDALCSDNALADSRDLVYDNGEHKVIQNPVIHLNSFEGCIRMPTFLYIHKTYVNVYVGYNPAYPSGRPLQYGIKSGTTYKNIGNLGNEHGNLRYSNNIKITSIGKTLIVSTGNDIRYFLWKDGKYKDLGSKIPIQKVTFTIMQRSGQDYAYVENTGACDGMFEDDRVPTKKHEDFNNLVIGLYSKNKKAIKNKKSFCLPFFARTALRLFDGSYTHISQPVMLFPSLTENSSLYDADGDYMVMRTYCNKMKYKNESFYAYDEGGGSYFEDWADIVQDIVIFITDGIEIHDLTVDQMFNQVFRSYTTAKTKCNGIYAQDGSSMVFHEYDIRGYRVLTPLGYTGGLQSASTEDIEMELTSRSVFYKLCSIGLFEKNDDYIDGKISTHHLDNLTTQEQLPYDDYFTHCDFSAETIFSYNSRLNIANVERSIFEGFDYFFPYAGFGVGGAVSSDYTGYCRFYVTIQTDEEEKIVMHEAYSPYYQGVWFYYPDSRAKHVEIFRKHTNGNWHRLLVADLKEHDGLNGAYYFKGLPNISQDNHESYDTSASQPSVSSNLIEKLPNYVITSEVNNPFFFKAEGYNKVGTGKIIGMSTITQALSQGQFGQFPLLVFSESGIWAMSLDGTGLFTSIHPMSREVCNDEKSITQTDGAVFFTSEKGLMVVTGNEVNCVSEQLNGKVDTFPSEYLGLTKYSLKDMLRNCCIAYDYRDSLLWIMGSGSSGYTYAIKNGTFSMSSVAPSSTIINNYPDTLIQEQTGEVYSLLERPNINEDSSTNYGGIIVTRPMKFENALALKSLLQVRHITDMQGTLKLRIFASNNFKKWVELHSLGGMPWKYYRFAYTFEGLKATYRFAGSVVVTQERRTDKIR